MSDADKKEMRQAIEDEFLEIAARVSAAVEQGPEATVVALEEAVRLLRALELGILGSFAVVVIAQGGDCGNPDCPVHGARAKERAAAASPATRRASN